MNNSSQHPPVVLIDTSHVALRIRRSSLDELSSRPTSPAISNIGIFCRSRPTSMELDARYRAQLELLESISNPKLSESSYSTANNSRTPHPVAFQFPKLPHNHLDDDNGSDTILYMEDFRKERVNSRTLADDDAHSLSPSTRTTGSSTGSSTRTLRRLPPGRIVGQFENDNLRIERLTRDPVLSKSRTVKERAPLDIPATSQILTPVRPSIPPVIDPPVAVHKKTNPELERYREYDPSAKRLPLVYRVVVAKNNIKRALQRKPKTQPTTSPGPVTPETKPAASLTNSKRSNSIKSMTASILRKTQPRTSMSVKGTAGSHLKSPNAARVRKVTFGSVTNTAALTSSSRAIEHRADRCRSVSFSGFANMSMGIVSPEEENDDLDPATREATLVANHFVGLYSF
ncbi:hypothetical protein M413DRAFT_26607 [Hebeloma cylindrosporum]|uniref:Uncharacterized protein n=1 Tax=Hebeloma cylindrosporum TaxID=76867 RepID=A0A0C3C110_HEBCY|nr:hypothetical protein M413DRAFT_26607 [Hebeloma cylindrosporum h7]